MYFSLLVNEAPVIPAVLVAFDVVWSNFIIWVFSNTASISSPLERANKSVVTPKALALSIVSVASTAYRFKALLILACVCARNCSLVKSGDAPDKVMFSTSETKLAAKRSTSMGVVKPVDEPSWFNLNRFMFKVSSTF